MDACRTACTLSEACGSRRFGIWGGMEGQSADRACRFDFVVHGGTHNDPVKCFPNPSALLLRVAVLSLEAHQRWLLRV